MAGEETLLVWRMSGYRNKILMNKNFPGIGLGLSKSEVLRPTTSMVSTLSLQSKDGCSNPVLLHFHKSRALIDPSNTNRISVTYFLRHHFFNALLFKGNTNGLVLRQLWCNFEEVMHVHSYYFHPVSITPIVSALLIPSIFFNRVRRVFVLNTLRSDIIVTMRNLVKN